MSQLLSRKEALAEAKRDNCSIVTGDDLHILLDLDTPDDEKVYADMLPLVEHHLQIREEKRWRSRNGGLHVVLASSRPLNVRSRLVIQACLGSDLKKEFLSLVRVWKGIEQPVMLFRPNSAPVRQQKPQQKQSGQRPMSRRQAAEPMPPKLRENGGFYGDILDDDVPF